MPAVPSSFIEPLWAQFEALLPKRPTYHPDHPLGCHKRRIKIGPSSTSSSRCWCSAAPTKRSPTPPAGATAIRDRRNNWIALGIFTDLERIVLDAYDRIIGLALEDIAVDGCITKAPGGGQIAGRSPVDRGNRAGTLDAGRCQRHPFGCGAGPG